MAVTIITSGKKIIENRVTGNSTNAYVTALDWDTRSLEAKTIVVANTGGTNAITYRILVRAWYTGTDFEEVSPTFLAAGDEHRQILSALYTRVKVDVIDAVANSHSGYAVDYEGQPI